MDSVSVCLNVQSAHVLRDPSMRPVVGPAVWASGRSCICHHHQLLQLRPFPAGSCARSCHAALHPVGGAWRFCKPATLLPAFVVLGRACAWEELKRRRTRAPPRPPILCHQRWCVWLGVVVVVVTAVCAGWKMQVKPPGVDFKPV